MRFLNADVDGDPLDLRDRAGDLDDLAMRDVAVGLDDHLAAPLLDAVGDGLPRLLERRHGPFADAPAAAVVSPPGPAGLVRVKNVAAVSSTPTPCRAGGTSTFSPPVICTENSMNVINWKTTSTIGVMSMCSFRSSFDVAAEQHGGGETSQ